MENVSSILQQVHEAMKAKYINSNLISNDIRQGQILTQFLSILKQRAHGNLSLSPEQRIYENLYDMILDNIQLPNKRTLRNLFTRTGRTSQQQGAMFEDDFAAVIKSVMDIADPQNKRKHSIANINIGSQVGTTDINLLPFMQEEIDAYKLDLIDKTYQRLEQKKVGFVFGKTDTAVQGEIINLNANIEFPPGVLEALSNATFTDKSYRSITYRNGTRIELGDRNITLGNSDPYRAVMGSMRALGFNQLATEYIYYGGRNIINGIDSTPPKENSDVVGRHIYHLRYMYELTGAGILYKNLDSSLSNGAKFIVYNDPMSMDIVVMSTSKIISDILQQQEVPDDPYGSISISSAYIKASSK